LKTLLSFTASSPEQTMENLCLIVSEYGHVGFNEEEVYLIKDIHFTKFTSHDQKIQISKNVKKTSQARNEKTSDSEDEISPTPQKNYQIKTSNLLITQPSQQSLFLFLFPNSSLPPQD